MDHEKNPLIAERLRKLDDLRKNGINPYPYKYNQTHHAQELLEKYKHLEKEHITNDTVSIAGRIMQLRRMGKITFMHVQDETGRLQVYAREDDLGKEYDTLKLFDIGDIIGVNGTIFTTKTGEITVHTKQFEMLTKSIRPLPEKWHGLTDKEERYRKRYLDLAMNQDILSTFKKRSMLIKSIRTYFHNQGYHEVETPALQIIYGGANAKPFKTHINAWNMTMYLSISPELYLKRLIVGGFEKVFTICKNFRNEGVDKSHNPEFTMLEYYQAYADCNTVMTLFEECIANSCKELYGTTKIKNGETELDFTTPWKRMTMIDAIKEFANIDVNKLSLKELEQELINYNITIDGEFSWGLAVQGLFEELCEDKLIQPIHIIDHPKESTPLCKPHQTDNRLIERVESYCMGMEISNGYSELNDPLLQRTLLEEQAAELRAGLEERHPMDEDFIEAIETGMPPTGGLGFGVDRIAVILLGVESIRDVILFPTMKPLQATVEEQEKKTEKTFKKALKEKKKK